MVGLEANVPLHFWDFVLRRYSIFLHLPIITVIDVFASMVETLLIRGWIVVVSTNWWLGQKLSSHRETHYDNRFPIAVLPRKLLGFDDRS